MPHNQAPDAEENTSVSLLRQLDKAVRHHVAPLVDIDHPAFCVLSTASGSAQRTYDALTRLHARFVDWHEMRVARRGEIAKVIHAFPDAERRAANLRAMYNRLFEERGRLDFGFLAGQKYTDGRRMLLQIWPTLFPGAAALILFEHCPGGQIPITDAGLAAARKLGFVPKGAARAQLQHKIANELDPAEAARLVQHLELQGNGHPYGTDWNQAEPKLTRAGRAAMKAEAEARAAAQPSMIPLPPSAASARKAELSPATSPMPPAPPEAPKTKPSKKKKSASSPAAIVAPTPSKPVSTNAKTKAKRR